MVKMFNLDNISRLEHPFYTLVYAVKGPLCTIQNSQQYLNKVKKMHFSNPEASLISIHLLPHFFSFQLNLTYVKRILHFVPLKISFLSLLIIGSNIDIL